MKSHKTRNRLTGRELFLYIARLGPNAETNRINMLSLAVYFPESARVVDLRFNDMYSPGDVLWTQSSSTPLTGDPLNKLEDGGQWLHHLCELFLQDEVRDLLVYLDLRHWNSQYTKHLPRPFTAGDFIDGITFGRHNGKFAGIAGISRRAAESIVESGLLLDTALQEPLVWQRGDPCRCADLVSRGMVDQLSLIEYAAEHAAIKQRTRPFDQFNLRV